MSLDDQDRDLLVSWFRGEGLTDEPAKYGDGIHSWRCEYPDVYGPCFCFEGAITDLNTNVEGIVAKHQAAILREAADQLAETTNLYVVVMGLRKRADELEDPA